MNWHYLQEQEEESWEGSYLDGAPDALLRLIPTAEKSSLQDKETGFSQNFQYGMTSLRSKADYGKDLLTWFREAFPVKTSLVQAKAKASEEKDPDFGKKWQELSMKYDPFSSSWKIHQCSVPEGSKQFSKILPFWGLMLNGAVYRRKTAERPIKGTGFGLWPTPTVNGNYNRKGLSKTSGDGLATAVKLWPTPRAVMPDNLKSSPVINKKGRIVRKTGQDFAINLRDAVNLWPTPTKSMATVGDQEQARFAGNDPRRPSYKEANKGGGQLNPTWVEWLMGWPIGWTDLKPLETDKFQEWLQQHGGC